MTEASKTKIGTDVATTGAKPDALEASLLEQAKTPEERALAFKLAGQARQSKMIRDVAVACAETGWGKEISPVSRAAVVRYCMEIGADPVRHVHVLGGTVYLNASFWMDLVAANPKFQKSETRFIHADPRCSTEEADRRRVERVTYGVPEDVKGAAVVVLFYDGRGPFVGVNWAGTHGAKKDPVGDAEPTKTAESRAYRRAAIKAEPAWFRGHPQLQAAEQLLVQGRELEKAGEALPPIGDKPVESADVPIAPIAPAGGNA